MEQKIVPHLWFDNRALEAVTFYTNIFENSMIFSQTTIPDTPSGDALLIQFQLENIEFSAINGGPFFHFNPSMSFFVFCDSKEEANRLWDAFKTDGTVLMEQQDELFLFYHGWIMDQFGLSWQICYKPQNEDEMNVQKIVPCRMFSLDQSESATELLEKYKQVFPKFELHELWKKSFTESADVRFARFDILGFQMILTVADANLEDTFNESVSYMLSCKDQDETDYYWDELSYDLNAEQCGWLKDCFNISWQIIPLEFSEIMSHTAPEKMPQLMETFMKMKKIDVEKLKKIAE